jgi:hypothetical protein
VTITPLSSFAGVVTLQANNLPAGVTPTFTQTGTWTWTMTLSTSAGTQAVTSTVTVTAQSGALSHSQTASLVVQDFSIGVSPGTASTTPGGTANYTVSVTPINGFNGPVNFSGPAGATFTPNALTGGGSTVMTVQVDAGAGVGTSNLTVNATSGGLSRPAQVQLTIQDFRSRSRPRARRMLFPAPRSATPSRSRRRMASTGRSISR